jgi:hypothetical protein
MRRVVLILACLFAAVGLSLFVRSRVVLHLAKARAEKEHADAKNVLNSVPGTARKLSVIDYTNVVSVSVAGVRLGFPSDQFIRDSNPKRENVHLYHSRYRVMVMPSADSKMFAPVMLFVGETNFYRFLRTAYNATERQIQEQSSMRALERHLILLEAKSMAAPVGFDSFCAEFDRRDLRGFIVGDPTRNKHLYIRFYLPRQEQFVDLGLIAKQPLQMSDIEELISVLKVEYK